MDFLTFNDAAKLLRSCGFQSGDMYDAIENQKLCCAMQMISYDSFARFLDYNSVYKEAFYNYDSGDDVYMKKLKDEILEHMEKTIPVCDEEYSIEEIEKIFNASKATIKKAIRKEKHSWRFMFRRHFSAVEILIYLKNHPDALEALKNRQVFLFQVGSAYEAPVRHILMLYSYYEGYGYIV